MKKNLLKVFGIAALAGIVSIVAAAAVDLYVIPNSQILFGKNNTGTKTLYFNNNAAPNNPAIRWNAGVLEFSNDGTTFFPISAGIPTGAEMGWPAETAPTGWLLEEGQALSRVTYSTLFSVIGVAYGIGDGTTTFNIPDMRGRFERNWDHGADNDPDNNSVSLVSNRISFGGGTHNITADSHSSFTLDNISTADMANIAVGMELTGGDMHAAPVYVTAKTGAHSITMTKSATGTNAGEVLAASDTASGDHPGSYQTQQFHSHTHDVITQNFAYAGGGNILYSWIVSVNNGPTQTTQSAGGNETRPSNIYKARIIKF